MIATCECCGEALRFKEYIDIGMCPECLEAACNEVCSVSQYDYLDEQLKGENDDL